MRKMDESAKVCIICRLKYTLKILITSLCTGTYRVFCWKNRTVKKVIWICRPILYILLILSKKLFYQLTKNEKRKTQYVRGPASHCLHHLQTLFYPKIIHNILIRR